MESGSETGGTEFVWFPPEDDSEEQEVISLGEHICCLYAHRHLSSSHLGILARGVR